MISLSPFWEVSMIVEAAPDSIKKVRQASAQLMTMIDKKLRSKANLV